MKKINKKKLDTITGYKKESLEGRVLANYGGIFFLFFSFLVFLIEDFKCEFFSWTFFHFKRRIFLRVFY